MLEAREVLSGAILERDVLTCSWGIEKGPSCHMQTLVGGGENLEPRLVGISKLQA